MEKIGAVISGEEVAVGRDGELILGRNPTAYLVRGPQNMSYPRVLVISCFNPTVEYQRPHCRIKKHTTLVVKQDSITDEHMGDHARITTLLFCQELGTRRQLGTA